jgi:hypothetical protein
VKIYHAVTNGTQAYAVHNLETDERAIVITTPIRVVCKGKRGFVYQLAGADRVVCDLCGRDLAGKLLPRHLNRDIGER